MTPKFCILYIPNYVSAFSLCESGRTIEYSTQGEDVWDSLGTGDVIIGFNKSEEPSFRYIFEVISKDSTKLQLKKVLDVDPGCKLQDSPSEIVEAIKDGNDLVQISYNSYVKLRKRMMRDVYSMGPLTSVPENYTNIITAMRTKPFLLLAGISGTGKSRIVRQLARACWPVGSDEANAHKPSNFEMIQVKPNWHDSSELIGYVSRIGDNPKFIAGDFLKFIAKAWENPDVPYFLCLDEMNLAPVEQYFAEYLSVIESRKLQDDGRTILTDPILDKVGEQWYYDLAAAIASETVKEDFLKNGIRIPQNLIVVGTVNMDETTYSFSRKVLDRAMTIEMNEVNLKGGLTKEATRMPYIPAEDMLADAVEGYDVYSGNEVVADKVIEYLGDINNVLANTPFRIAYRTRNEFLIYVINAIRLAGEEAASDGAKRNSTIATALDEVTSMKILSRIEGDKRKVPFLGELKETIKHNLETIGGSTLSAKDSVSLAKLDTMIERLKSGYTSFWD